jgi:hypothetical protein
LAEALLEIPVRTTGGTEALTVSLADWDQVDREQQVLSESLCQIDGVILRYGKCRITAWNLRRQTGKDLNRGLILLVQANLCGLREWLQAASAVQKQSCSCSNPGQNTEVGEDKFDLTRYARGDTILEIERLIRLKFVFARLSDIRLE